MLNFEKNESRMNVEGTQDALVARDGKYEIAALTHVSNAGLILVSVETEIGFVEVVRMGVPPADDIQFLMFVLQNGFDPPTAVIEDPDTDTLPQIEYVKSFAEQLYETRLDKPLVEEEVAKLVQSVKDGTYVAPDELTPEQQAEVDAEVEAEVEANVG